MTTLQKDTVIVIDPDENKAEETRKRLERSMRKIAIINTKCLTLRREEINELVHNTDYQKMFYGCSKKFFDEMFEDFELKVKDREVIYIGWGSDISTIVINYWNYFWKKKDLGVFQSTVSNSEGSRFQEL